MVDRDVLTRTPRRTHRVVARKPALAALFAVAIAVGTLASAPAAMATGNNYQWTGSDETSPDWAQTDNWLGGVSPSATIGTLSFPDLGAACDSGSSSDTCYASNDQLGSLTAGQLEIDDDQAYSISADNSSALTLDGGLSAAPTETAVDDMSGDPTLGVPITVAADQTWAIDGGNGGYYGIAVPQISGSHTLNLSFTNEGSLSTTAITNTSVVASGYGTLIVQPGGDFGSGGATVEDDASLIVEGPMSPSASEGSLSVSGTQADQPTVAVEAGSDPDAKLVASNVSLDQWTSLYLELDDDDNTPDAAGDPQGFSQLAAVNVNLGGAMLYLDQGWADPIGDCVTLSPGDSFPVITASGTLRGDLTYVDDSGNPDTLAPGQTSQPIPVSLPEDCADGTPANPALATLTYKAQTITANVVSASAGSSTSTTSGTGGGTSKGGNPPTTATGKATAQVRAALGRIGHPSDAREIREFTRSGVFKARFAAPTAGELSITWTATVTTGSGKHRKHRTVTVATGSAHASGKGAIDVTVHLTSAGRSLLRRKPHHLAITDTGRFKPTGDGWTTLTRHFSL